MKVYVILESYTDYNGGNATSFGVFKTKEKAVAELPHIILKQLDGVGDFKKVTNKKFTANFKGNERDYWCWDRDDDTIEFYIQQDELED